MLKVSRGNDRFLLEVHPKLRPVETAVNGVVLAGTAQGPMNIQESLSAASAAAAKVAALLGRGQVELPPFVASVDAEKCNGTGACVEACLYEGAIALQTFEENGRQITTRSHHPGQLRRLRRVRQRLPEWCHRCARLDAGAVRSDGRSHRHGNTGFDGGGGHERANQRHLHAAKLLKQLRTDHAEGVERAQALLKEQKHMQQEIMRRSSARNPNSSRK